MNYFFDTYAIIEILKNNRAYRKYVKLPIVTSILNIGELYYHLLKEFGRDYAMIWYNLLKKNIITIDADTIIVAMEFRYRNIKKKLSFIDCVGYILALKEDLPFLTGDEEFKGLPNVEFVK